MKIMLFTIVLVLMTNVKSHSQIIFQDDFSTNDNNWSFVKSKHFNLKINDNALEIEKKLDSDNRSACLWYSKKIDRLNTGNDFSIEFDFKILEIDPKDTIVDFSWGNISIGENFLQFSFNTKGYFTLGLFEKENEPAKWTYLKRTVRQEILKIESFNKIKISQEGDICSIFLNNIQIIKQKINKIDGSDIGFLQCNKVKWAIDNLVIKQISI